MPDLCGFSKGGRATLHISTHEPDQHRLALRPHVALSGGSKLLGRSYLLVGFMTGLRDFLRSARRWPSRVFRAEAIHYEWIWVTSLRCSP